MSDAYERIGYAQGRVGFGQRPAIVVVDFQRAFTDGEFQMGGVPEVIKALENTAVLLETARRNDVPIAASYTAYASPDEMPHWKVAAVRRDFLFGHPCTELDPRIHDPERDFAFSKGGASAFFQTRLHTFLTRHGVDTVVVTGCTTSGCVRATVVDAFSHGYRVIVPAECSGDPDEEAHRVNLRDMDLRYADILGLAEVSVALEDHAK